MCSIAVLKHRAKQTRKAAKVFFYFVALSHCGEYRPVAAKTEKVIFVSVALT